MTNVKPFAFVLMPFTQEFKDIYGLGIKSTAKKFDVVAERVDEQFFSETILERVYRQIDNCDFVIADMTGRNPNVFYEVGYAHARGKLCALLTQEVNDIPFDLKHHRHVIYDGSATDLATKLQPELGYLIAESAKRKSQQITVSHNAGTGFLQKGEYFHDGSFDLEVTIRNKSERRTPEIEAFYLLTTQDWKIRSEKTTCVYDDIEEHGSKLRKHLINPPLRRLSPQAFLKIKPEFERTFWSKYGGGEAKEEYHSKGNVKLDIVTSEGTLSFDIGLDVTFDEIPF